MQFNIVGTDRTYKCWILNNLANVTRNGGTAVGITYTIPIAYTSTATYNVNFSLQANHSMQQTCSIVSPSVFYIGANYSSKYTIERVFCILFGY